MDQTQLAIKEFLSRFFKSHDLRPDEDIFALGFVNSLLAMQLVAFIEKTSASASRTRTWTSTTSARSTPSPT